MLVQMGIGTFIVSLGPIFWFIAQQSAIVFVILGMIIILHTIYTDSKRTNAIVTGLQTQINALKTEITELKKGSMPTKPVS
jgi:hypothetical protein